MRPAVPRALVFYGSAMLKIGLALKTFTEVNVDAKLDGP
jgi:hypothetical protein